MPEQPGEDTASATVNQTPSYCHSLSCSFHRFQTALSRAGGSLFCFRREDRRVPVPEERVRAHAGDGQEVLTSPQNLS